MIYKQPSPKAGHVRVVFELPSCVWADKICLSGDFNDWDECNLPLVQNRGGVWRAEVDLPSGQRYEFRYLVDGQWQTDYHADGFVPNRFGADNSIVIADLPPVHVNGAQGQTPLSHGATIDPAVSREPILRFDLRQPWIARLEPRQAIVSAA